MTFCTAVRDLHLMGWSDGLEHTRTSIYYAEKEPTSFLTIGIQPTHPPSALPHLPKPTSTCSSSSLRRRPALGEHQGRRHPPNPYSPTHPPRACGLPLACIIVSPATLLRRQVQRLHANRRHGLIRPQMGPTAGAQGGHCAAATVGYDRASEGRTS